MNIDISMTATLRPDIHTKVFESLKKHLKTKNNLRLILNIDPIGYENTNQFDILINAYDYFENIKYNISRTPNFFNACRWTWNNVDTDFIFQWEDDWILNKDLYLDDCIELMKLKDMDIFGFFFPRDYKKINIYKEVVNNRIYRYAYNNKISMSFGPSILKKEYVKSMVKIMNEHKDYGFMIPRQLFKSSKEIKNFMKTQKHGKFIDDNFESKHNKNLLKDLGRSWKRQHNMKLKRAKEYKKKN